MSFLGSLLSILDFNNQVTKRPTPSIPSPEPPYYPIPPVHQSRYGRSWWQGISEAIFRHQDNVTISEAQWLKEIGGLGHDSLMVTVNVAKPAYIAFLAIERTTNKELVESVLEGNSILQHLPNDTITSMTEADKAKIQETLRKKLREELKLIDARNARDFLGTYPPYLNRDRKPDPHTAFDMITRADTNYGVAPTLKSLNVKCIKRFTFDAPNAPKFLLQDLGIMVREINYCQPECSLAEHNSFWFARTLVDVIVTMKNPTTEIPDHRDFDLAGCLANDDKFGHIVGSNPTEVDELIIRIENGIQEDKKKIRLREETLLKARRKPSETEDDETQKSLADSRRELAIAQQKCAEAQADLANREHLYQGIPDKFEAAKKALQENADNMAELQAQMKKFEEDRAARKKQYGY